VRQNGLEDLPSLGKALPTLGEKSGRRALSEDYCLLPKTLNHNPVEMQALFNTICWTTASTQQPSSQSLRITTTLNHRLPPLT
jgi:hypothetical protein